MLSESDVISAVCEHLENRDYKIIQKLNESEKGDDIIGIDSAGRKCFIEAKGETSSKQDSSRFGKAFSSSQVSVHVAKAFYRAVQMKEENPDTCKVGIALPDTSLHKKQIERIKNTLEELMIEVFWVDGRKSVSVQENWKRST